ncbi:DNA (cytosine-5-)-methyltransferase [Burkholderia arboris]|uniref:Cytosine-specific methyltransferase n=1 Tax=Burkholderia arboris TaxID=488730 RepID=A0ABZ3DG68_9BURK
MPKSLEITAIFGGIGGLELGLHRSGHRTSLFCECDPEATTVLQHQFAGVPIVSDIKQTDEVLAKISPASNLLTAGFPCTDLSQAGRTRGFAGGRSSLIRETIELLRRRPFANVLIENVPNWRHLHKGEYMAEVLSALEGLGYRWAYRTIDALAFGLPQRRNRIFVFATLEGDPRRVLFHGNHAPVEGEKSLTESAHGFYWTEGTRGLGWGEDCIPTMKGGSAMGIPSPPAILLPDLSVITPSANDAERLQGFPDGWTDFEGVVDENGHVFNKRRRWMLIGNAVNVAVSTWLGEQLATQRPYEGEPGTPLVEGKSWPAAAWFDGKVRYEVPIGTWPVNEDRQPLARFLNHSGAPLSLRATAGFYKRICESTLRFKPGFKEAIAAHLKRMEAFTIIATPKAPKKPAVESVEMA